MKPFLSCLGNWTPARCRLLASRALLLLAATALSGASIQTTAPVKKFALPTFTAEGYPEMLLRGEEVRLPGNDRIEATDMQLTVFSGKADEKIDTVLISKQATYFPSRRVAEGSQGVRVVQDTIEMSGERWSYSQEGKTKKVVIDGAVRVIFQHQLNDILK